MTDFDEAAWRAFRTARDQELRQPFGWLTIGGFAWLESAPARIAGLPGLWHTDGHLAHRVAAPGDLLVGPASATVAETARMRWLTWGDTEIELLRRDGRLAVRWRTATSPARESFVGVPTYPFDPAWVVRGRFVPYHPERSVDVATHRPELRQQLRAVGEVRFTLAGRQQRLVVTSIKYGLSVEFHDPTNGTETPAWRQLKLDPPQQPDASGAGDVVLDFNRTINMWFAFTDHATCPAPCADNRVDVPVRAGERAPVPTR